LIVLGLNLFRLKLIQTHSSNMSFRAQFKKELFDTNSYNFTAKALALVAYQYENNVIYRRYLDYLGIKPNQLSKIEQIPFLPIDFFKYHEILSGNEAIEAIFESSGTTAQVRSRHLVQDLALYRCVSRHIFEMNYGKLSDYHILALLPSYLERGASSLVSMVEDFIKVSDSPHGGFYLNEQNSLIDKIQFLLQQGDRKVLLIGVTFALLDLAEKFPIDLSSLIVMETGGMKGRRAEMIRSEVHQILKKAWNLDEVHSEYGMTELLSQAYSTHSEVFTCPPWMKVIWREVHDPFAISQEAKSGAINVIDLANIDSCAFIATQDLGRRVAADEFQVLGRVDNSDIRGCNLLVL
jgi:Acyl-protein synthetase, LuxE